MKKNNISGIFIGVFLGLVIAIIVVGVLFITGNINFKSNTVVEQEQTTTNNDIKGVEDVAKTLGEKMYLNLYSFETAYVFCGENMVWNNKEDYISDPNIGDYYHAYDVSQDFKSINELNDYLKTYMTEDVIKKYYQTDSGIYKYEGGKYVNEIYVEKDGKLYCRNYNKDHGFVDYDEDNSIYNIVTRTENSVVVSATIGYREKGDTTTLNVDKLQYEVIKSKDNWLVKSFLNIPEGLVNIRSIELYLNEIVSYNDLNPHHKITVVYDGEDYLDSNSILSIVSNLDSWQESPNDEKWRVFNVIYNKDGYISKLVIK